MLFPEVLLGVVLFHFQSFRERGRGILGGGTTARVTTTNRQWARPNNKRNQSKKNKKTRTWKCGNMESGPLLELTNALGFHLLVLLLYQKIDFWALCSRSLKHLWRFLLISAHTHRHTTTTHSMMQQHRRAAGVRSKPPPEAGEEGGGGGRGPSSSASSSAAAGSAGGRLLAKDDDEGKVRFRPAKVGIILLLLVVAVGFLFVVHDLNSSSSSSPSSSPASSFFAPLTGEAAETFNTNLAQFLTRARMGNTETPLREQDYTKDLGVIDRFGFLYFPTEAPLARVLRDVLVGVLDASVWTVGEHSKEGNRDDEEILEGSAGSLVEIAPRHSLRGKPVHVWFTAHVPPYGYGKGHGLSGFIRLLSFPTSPASPVTESPQALADFVRWHCRLSHALAHTHARTLDMTDSNTPSGAPVVRLLEQLWDFLGLDPSKLGEARYVGMRRASEAWPEGGVGKVEKPWLPSELVETFGEEVGRMEEWPCGFFESEGLAEALRPVCEGVEWVHCSIGSDFCQGQLPCPALEAWEASQKAA